MKLVKESLKGINLLDEGLGEQYLKRKYPQYDWEFENFDKKFNDFNNKNIEVIAEDGDWKLYKNPGSLQYLGPKVRGVITLNGDLYIENFSDKIHNDILSILFKKGILKGKFKKNWTRKLPDDSGFLTVQRYNNSSIMAIGESNRLIYEEDDWNNLIKKYKPILKKAAEKNPGIKFIDKLIGKKIFKKNK